MDEKGQLCILPYSKGVQEDIKSTWRAAKVQLRPVYCQTEPLQQWDADTQAPDRASKEVDAVVEADTEDPILQELSELVEADQLHQLRSESLPIAHPQESDL